MFRFVSRLILIDTVRNKRYYFVCNAWLAADIGDGLVDRQFTKATKKELHDAEHLFFTNTTTFVFTSIKQLDSQLNNQHLKNYYISLKLV